MDHLNQCNHIFNRRFWQDPMTKIKYVSHSTPGLFKNSFRLRLQSVARREQRNGIEVSHHCNVVADSLTAFVEPNTPVESNDVAARFTHQFEQGRGPRAKVNNRNASFDSFDHGPRMRQHKLPIIIRTQTPNP